MKLVKEGCEAAQEKIAKYFSPEKGMCTSLTFLKEVDHFYPIKGLSFNDSFEFLVLEEMNEISNGEKRLYKNKPESSKV